MSSELYQVANYGLAGHYYSHYDQVKQQGYDQQLIQVEDADIVNIVIIKVLILSILLSSRC